MVSLSLRLREATDDVDRLAAEIRSEKLKVGVQDQACVVFCISLRCMLTRAQVQRVKSVGGKLLKVQCPHAPPGIFVVHCVCLVPGRSSHRISVYRLFVSSDRSQPCLQERDAEHEALKERLALLQRQHASGIKQFT